MQQHWLLAATATAKPKSTQDCHSLIGQQQQQRTQNSGLPHPHCHALPARVHQPQQVASLRARSALQQHRLGQDTPVPAAAPGGSCGRTVSWLDPETSSP